MNVNWDSITSLIYDWIYCFVDFVSEHLVLLCFVIVFVLYLFLNKKRINNLSEKKLEEFKRNGKYRPLLFVELSNAKELLRYFIYGSKWKQKLIRDFNQIYARDSLLQEYVKDSAVNQKLRRDLPLNKVRESLQKNIDYFSNPNSFQNTLKKFPDYKYFLEASNFKYLSSLNELKEKSNIIDSKIVLIKSSAGNGKTALACNMVELLLKLNNRVIFINSKDVNSSFKEYLIDRLGLFLPLMKWKEYIYNYFFRIFKTYILVDAINENDEKDFPGQLFKELDKLANDGAKIILTCREEYFEQRFSKFVGDMSNQPHIVKIDEPYIEGRAAEKLLERYCKAYNVNVPLPHISRQLFSISLLLLRLYFEVNKGKKSQDISLYRYKIYSQYVEYLKNKYDNDCITRIINSIAKFMVENHIYNHVLLTDVSDNEQDKNFIRTISDDNLLTARKIVQNENTIAEETSEEVIYFPFDELRDYCLAHYLVKKYLNEVKEHEDGIAKKNLFDFLSILERGFSSPLEGILHYLYLHFKSQNQNDICEELLKKGFYDCYFMNGEHLFNNLALNVVFDTEQTLENYEIKYIAGILAKGTQDTHTLFRYLFYRERNGAKDQLSILLKILYSYTNTSDMEKVFSCYKAYRYDYYIENEHVSECLEKLLYAVENRKCLCCIEYLVIVALVVKDSYKIQSRIVQYSGYSNILQKIIAKSSCNALKQMAASLNNNIEPDPDEKLIKALKEDLEDYGRN